MPEIKYKRVLLKISGEALSGPYRSGIDTKTVNDIAGKIREVVDLGVSIAVVVGGGNIWRGAKAEADGMDRVNADYAGIYVFSYFITAN